MAVIKLTKLAEENSIDRLVKIKGHIRKVESMLADGESVVEVMHQLQAIQGALLSLDRVLITDVMRHGLPKNMKSGDIDKLIEEFLRIYKMKP